jgi:isoamylase
MANKIMSDHAAATSVSGQEERPLSDYVAAVSEHSNVRRGTPFPFGALKIENGVNFAFFSRHGSRVRLEFFDTPDSQIASRFIELDSRGNRTGDVWHVWVADILPGQLYGFRVDGPYQPEQGHRFNFNKLLLDPHARAISPVTHWDFKAAYGYDLSAPELASSVNDTGAMPKCVFIFDQFDWQNDQPPKHCCANTFIYETHIRGLSFHPSAKVSHPGTFRGLIEKIPHFKELGITAVELMPIQEFNATEAVAINPQTNTGLTNYWGYDSVGFYATKASYSSAGGFGQQTLEFKQLVLEMHKAGIEVILDIVFNHTAEGDQSGPTFSFRGIDNSIFYMLEADKRFYKNFAGTGNTINANHPVVREYLLSALRYWVIEMHVDGFRFDLASILGRDTQGNLLESSPLLDFISEDPILRDVKLIAEAWDMIGYEVGNFSHRRWAEWNGHFRDDVRRFWRGDDGMLGLFAKRLGGSSDVYAKSGKSPKNSVNYITCHDGFTLNDLVSFNEKHNLENGHNNQDGTNENYSVNFGVEGPSDDPQIVALRKRQIKNFLVTLYVARGLPMLMGGDEFLRTQKGNNNAYCQDNEISWYNWDFLQKNQEIFQFTKTMIAFRKAHPALCKEEFYVDGEIKWFNSSGMLPDWNNSRAHELACLIYEEDQTMIYMMFNPGSNDIEFTLPILPPNFFWSLAVDTGRTEHQSEIQLDNNTKTYLLKNHACAILLARGRA